MSKQIVVLQNVRAQVSPDYDTMPYTRTLVASPDTTLGEVLAWSAKVGSPLGLGDITVTTADVLPEAT